MTSKSLVEQLIHKLGLYDESHIIDKSTELLRLLELKSNNISGTIGDYAKIVLCISLAADVLDISIDHVNALKVSGLKKTQYVNYKRMFEKVLDLNKPVGINEICIQLGLNEVAKKAISLLEFYKSTLSDINEDDLSHPQYAAMAVFQACRLAKKKISKTKIVTLSHLRSTQWVQLQKNWEKLIDANPSLKSTTIMKRIENDCDDDCGDKEKSIKSAIKKKVKECEEESYEDWRDRILAKARKDLADMEASGEVKKMDVHSDDEGDESEDI